MDTSGQIFCHDTIFYNFDTRSFDSLGEGLEISIAIQFTTMFQTTCPCKD